MSKKTERRYRVDISWKAEVELYIKEGGQQENGEGKGGKNILNLN